MSRKGKARGGRAIMAGTICVILTLTKLGASRTQAEQILSNLGDAEIKRVLTDEAYAKSLVEKAR